MTDPLPPLDLRCRQPQTVSDGASSHKIDYIAQGHGILNPEGY